MSYNNPVPQIQEEASLEASASPVVLPKDYVGSLIKSNATPSVRNLTRLRAGGVAVTITDFKDGQDGQTIKILGDGLTNVASNANIVRGAGGVLTSDRVYTFTNFGGVWYEDI